MRAARRRGIVFDVAHGRNHVNFPVARRAFEQDFYPDTISSDLTRPGRASFVRDLPTTLSKFLSLGMPLADVVRAATAAPARAIGRAGTWGHSRRARRGTRRCSSWRRDASPTRTPTATCWRAAQRWAPRLTVRAGPRRGWRLLAAGLSGRPASALWLGQRRDAGRGATPSAHPADDEDEGACGRLQSSSARTRIAARPWPLNEA